MAEISKRKQWPFSESICILSLFSSIHLLLIWIFLHFRLKWVNVFSCIRDKTLLGFQIRRRNISYYKIVCGKKKTVHFIWYSTAFLLRLDKNWAGKRGYSWRILFGEYLSFYESWYCKYIYSCRILGCFFSKPLTDWGKPSAKRSNKARDKKYNVNKPL